MKIGYLYTSDDHDYHEALCMIANAKGIDYFVFRLSDVNTEDMTINGLFWNQAKEGLHRRKTGYPEIVDSRVMRRVHDEAYKSLSSHCLISGVSLYDKQYIFELINKSPYSNYLINSHEYQEAALEKYLECYGEIIVKPIRGNKGRGVCKLSKAEELYAVTTHDFTELLNQNEYKAKYGDEFLAAGSLIQPYLNLSANDGSPFDVRVNVHRGKKGKWVRIGKMIRLAKKEGLVSNIAGGGYLLSRGINRFFENEVNCDPKKINSEIKEIATKIPDVVQGGYVNKIQTLGFDIGINRDNGDVKIIEVNGNPAIFHPIQLKTIFTKFDYYEYLYENIDSLMKNQIGLQ